MTPGLIGTPRSSTGTAGRWAPAAPNIAAAAATDGRTALAAGVLASVGFAARRAAAAASIRPYQRHVSGNTNISARVARACRHHTNLDPILQGVHVVW